MTQDQDKTSMTPQAEHELEESSVTPEESPRVVIEFQGVSQQVIAQVWEQLKNGITPEGAAFTLARSMVDHQHWYAFYETIGIFETSLKLTFFYVRNL